MHMRPIELLSTDIPGRLAALDEKTIPRSVKFIKTCLDRWLTNEKAEISPPELFNLCYERAGDNGCNAFMRAVISLVKEKDVLPPRFWKLLADNHELPWVKNIIPIARSRFPNAESEN